MPTGWGSLIYRDPSGAANLDYDLLVIGGGVYGASLMREAASRGLSVCLCDTTDFGSGASSNSLRILHGGLRYLRGFDLPRVRQSVMARQQWRSLFPSLVEPLRFVMPLDGRGLRKSLVFGLALAVNDQLTGIWDGEPVREQRFPAGGVLPSSVEGMPESFRVRGKRGFAVWYDGLMQAPERILMEMLSDGCRRGSVALNYCHVSNLLFSANQVHGALIHDRLTNAQLEIRARMVVDCAGVASGQLFSANNTPIATSVVAANLLLDLNLSPGTAMAIYEEGPRKQVFFLVPCHGYTMAGTAYFARSPGSMDTNLSGDEVEEFKERLEAALPGYGIHESVVLRVHSGLLPSQSGTPSVPLAQERFYDHGRMNGVRGVFSMIGVKYTTALTLARRVVDRLFPGSRRPPEAVVPVVEDTLILADPFAPEKHPAATLRGVVERLIRNESVHSLEDLIYRRTAWGLRGQDSAEAVIAPLLAGLPERVPA